MPMTRRRASMLMPPPPPPTTHLSPPPPPPPPPAIDYDDESITLDELATEPLVPTLLQPQPSPLPLTETTNDNSQPRNNIKRPRLSSVGYIAFSPNEGTPPNVPRPNTTRPNSGLARQHALIGSGNGRCWPCDQKRQSWAPGTVSPPQSRERLHRRARRKSEDEFGQ